MSQINSFKDLIVYPVKFVYPYEGGSLIKSNYFTG